MKKTFLIEYNYYKTLSNKLKNNRNTSPDKKYEILNELCAYNRINTLASIYFAGRGWIGASLSIAEIITNLYFDCADLSCNNSCKRDRILLSKGHAAVMQYSALAGSGFIETRDLLKYKRVDGLQAHTDISTNGIDINSGSLGQTLSKAAGLAFNSNNKNKIFVILGDGELQEGQNYEAFMTIIKFNLFNVIPIIDKNNIQSDSNVKDIKSIKNLYYTLCGFGFDVYNVNGNDIEQTNKLFWKIRETEKPSVIIANTSKGAGISYMQSSNSSRRQYSWHSGVPSEPEYYAALEELSALVRQKKLKTALKKFIYDFKKNEIPERQPETLKKTSALSTGTAFSKTIFNIAKKNKSIYCLDADLEKSCKLTEFALKFPDRFVELGISEQDMISFAGGLALKGKLPVTNTYASFYRRCFEQIYVNCSEHKKIIYAGHYSGLCYSTDGKSHQCSGDINMMRTLPDMFVFHPAFPEEINLILKWYFKQNSGKSIYFKLHRTPSAEYHGKIPNIKFKFGWGLAVKTYKSGNNRFSKTSCDSCILTSGPHLTLFCCQAADYLKKEGDKEIDVYSVSTLRYIEPAFVEKLCRGYKNIFVIEENYPEGGLFDEICDKIFRIKNIRVPRLFHKAADGFSFSTLEPFGLYKHFSLDKDSVIKYILSNEPF
ncbi:MAG TPA: transketolase C-terminal domain-containing protein [bacterium]|nr:transketolase C-terminal domain-containing protein [bacterium]